MADDDVVIQANAGPYKGKRLTVSAADAKAAIKDGWATDPFAEPGETKELTDEERARIVEAAEKAASKLRGETEEGDTSEKKTRAMEAEDSAEYQTKSSGAKSRK